MKLNKELIKSQIAQAKALESHAVIYGCLSTIERECKKFGVDYPISYWEEEEIDFNISQKRINVSVRNSKVNYDTLMSNKHTYIANVKKIQCNYSIIQVLVGYGISANRESDIELEINFNFSCPLPEEDLATLRNLGKVKVEHNNYSSISESVICDI